MKCHMRFFALSAAVFSLAAVSFGQTTLTQLWKINADTQAWLTTNTNSVRGLSVVPGGSVLVASRDGANDIVRLDPATGTKLGTLAGNSIFTGGYFPLNKVCVADDGAIFAGNLTTGPNYSFKIHRWANEADAAPVTIITETSPSVRLGDDMSVRGSGNNTVILVSGATVGTVMKYVTDGTTWTSTVYGSPFPIGNVLPHIALDPDGASFWVRTSTTNAKKYNLATGADQTFAVGSDATTADSGYGPINVVAYGSVKALTLGIGASAAGSTGKPVIVFDATRPAPSNKLFQAFGSELTGGAAANGNGTGAVAIDVARNRLYSLYTNNSVSAYSLPATSASDWNLLQ